MSIQNYFSNSYNEAREKFLSSTQKLNGSLQSFENPNLGPGGEKLFTDLAQFGSKSPKKLLIINSGTHGVEGFYGSGVQNAWLETWDINSLPEDTALWMIHAINPYGFAHMRRTNEDNIDLNRNFRDHATEPERNSGYDEIANWVIPQDYFGEEKQVADQKLESYRKEKGEKAYREAMARGQYHHPEGLFYGGVKDSWSFLTFKNILSNITEETLEIIFIDLHTGLGEHGDAQLLYVYHGEEDQKLSQSFFDKEMVILGGPNSNGEYTVTGSTVEFIKNHFPNKHVYPVTVECGTYPHEDMKEGLRAETWLQYHGDLNSELGQKIKARFKENAYPESPKWKEMIWAQTQRTFQNALDALIEDKIK